MNQTDLYKIQPTGTDANGSALFEISINRDCEIFRGHFPGQPVLPGVCSIEIVRESLSIMMGRDVHVCRISQCKFTGMVNPMQETILNATILLRSSKSQGESEVVAEVLCRGRSVLKLKGVIF